VPELVAGAMAVAEDGQKQVPVALPQKVLDQRTLAVDPRNQPVTQVAVLCRAAVRRVALAHRIHAEALGDLVC
jgi:hypothetical protein